MNKIAIFTTKNMKKLLDMQRFDLYESLVDEGHADIFYLEDNFQKKIKPKNYSSIILEEPAFLTKLNTKLFYKNIKDYQLPIFIIVSDYFLYPILLKRFVKYYRINHIFVNHETAPMILNKILPKHVFYDTFPIPISNNLPTNNLLKTNNILYTGSTHYLQSFRQRLFDVISKNFFVKQINHPGNRPNKNDSKIVTGLSYLEEIAKSYFVINCTTNNQISTRKCFEIPACCSTIIGNLPKDYSLTKVSRNTVLVNPEMSDMEILNIVDEALKNKKEYYKRAKNLSLFIRENYSAKSVANSMAERISFLINSGLYHNKFIPKTEGNYFSEIFHI